MLPRSVVLLGARLRSARLRSRFSQSDVARYMRVAKDKVIAWERGDMVPGRADLIRLGWALGLQPAFLVGPALATDMNVALEQVAGEMAAFGIAPAANSKLKGYGSQPLRSLAPLRCGRCGRWVALRTGRCEPCEKGTGKRQRVAEKRS